jgi:DNA-directed RNA polymerase specialized sigma24 family protein
LESKGEVGDFDKFVRDLEPRLRRALVASFGAERGREATAEALAWAFEHRGQLATLRNPAAYLFRVGQSRTRAPRQRRVFERPVADEPWVEPKLGSALMALSERERAAVIMVHGAGLSLGEAASVLGVSRAALQKRAERALRRLRIELDGMSDEQHR